MILENFSHERARQISESNATEHRVILKEAHDIFGLLMVRYKKLFYFPDMSVFNRKVF